MSPGSLNVLEQISDLVQSALEQVDDPSVPTSTVARRALRIARLRNDWEAQWWLQLEMTTPNMGDGQQSGRKLLHEVHRIGGDVAAHLTRDEFATIGPQVVRRWMSARSSGKSIHSHSIAALEQLVLGFEAQISEMTAMPVGMNPADLYRTHQRSLEGTTQLRVAAIEMNQMLAQIRSQLADYLSATEQQLLFGQVNSDVFERNRRWVDERLARDAPEVLEQFASAYRRQADGDAESGSHALTSCRRVLKTLADLLYPADNAVAEGIDGVNRKMSDDKFISRLVQFATENAPKSASRDVLLAQINALAARLAALNDLSSKGVHAAVSAAEVDQCLIQTYLAVGDLLRLADADSGAILADAAAS